ITASPRDYSFDQSVMAVTDFSFSPSKVQHGDMYLAPGGDTWHSYQPCRNTPTSIPTATFGRLRWRARISRPSTKYRDAPAWRSRGSTVQRCFVISNISDSAATKIARLETRSYRKNFELLVALVTEGFSNIAKVPEVNVDRFTGNLVNEMARWLLVEARTRIGIGKSAIQFFDAIEKVAQYLRQALARIEPAYLEEQWTGEHSPSVQGEEIYFLEFHLRLGDILSQSPQSSNVSALRATLANVATAARNYRYMIQGDVGVHPKRGRPRGPTRFRDLETLVFGLEFIARLAGGGFT